MIFTFHDPNAFNDVFARMDDKYAFLQQKVMRFFKMWEDIDKGSDVEEKGEEDSE